MTDSKRIVPWVALTTMLILMAIALGLRLWGIAFGLPYLYHFDEHFYVNTALKTGTGVLHYPPNTVPGLPNLLLFEYGTYYVLGKLTGMFSNGSQFEAAFRSDPTAFYLLGRVTSVLLSTAGVLVTYWLASLTFSRLTGLIAAAFLAVAFMDVRNAHYLIPDVALAFFVVLTVALACTGVKNKRLSFVYWAALAGGITTAMKWTGLAVIAPIGLAGYFAAITSTSVNTKVIKTWLLAGMLFLSGFVLSAPQVLLAPQLYMGEIMNQRNAGSTGGFELWQVDTVPGWIFYIKMLYYGLGLPMLLLALIGFGLSAAQAVRRRVPIEIVFISFPTFYFLAMGATFHYFARYVLPLLPFAVIFAAYAVVKIAIVLGAQRRWLGWAVAIFLVVIGLLPSLIASVRHDILLTRTDTRTLAKEWIEQNIPAGARIAVEWRTHGPPLATADRAVPYAARVFAVEHFEQAGLSERPLEWYQEQGFDYMVTTSFIADSPLVSRKKDQVRRVFYQSLADESQLVQAFYPTNDKKDAAFVFDEIYGPLVSLWERERPGPTLKIYKLSTED